MRGGAQRRQRGVSPAFFGRGAGLPRHPAGLPRRVGQSSLQRPAEVGGTDPPRPPGATGGKSLDSVTPPSPPNDPQPAVPTPPPPPPSGQGQAPTPAPEAPPDDSQLSGRAW